MSGLYAPDGSFNVTVVTGSVFTGVMAANGSYNVILAPGGSFVGTMHKCGAYYVTVTDAGKKGLRAPDGSLYITTSPYISNGATRVTITAGGQVVAPVLTLISGPLDNTPNFVVTPGLGEVFSIGDTLTAFWSQNSDLSSASTADNVIDSGESLAAELDFTTGPLANGHWYFGFKHLKTSRPVSAMSNIEDEIIAVVTSTTWNPADKAAGVALSNGNLTTKNTSGANAYARSVASIVSGQKVYFEATIDVLVFSCAIGFATSAFTLTGFLGNGSPTNGFAFRSANTFANADGSFDGFNPFSGSIAQGDTVDVAYDDTAKLVWFRKNNGAWNPGIGGSQDPATGAGGMSVVVTAGALFAAIGGGDVNDQQTTRFATASWLHTPPVGYTPLA